MQMLRELSSRGILDKESMRGLQELVTAGNKAAHGAFVEDGIAEWAIDTGQYILTILDDKLYDF